MATRWNRNEPPTVILSNVFRVPDVMRPVVRKDPYRLGFAGGDALDVCESAGM